MTDKKAVLLLVHGLGAHAGRWDDTISFFDRHGIASYAVELGNIEDLDKTELQIKRIYDIAAKENSDKKIFLAGESLGGLISLLFAAKNPKLFGGLICISPAFANRYKPSFLESLNILTSLFYNPKKQFKLPFDSSMCTRDPYHLKKMREDPREYRSVSIKLIFEILLAQIRARRAAINMTTPAFFLIAGDDKIADSRAAKEVFRAIAAEDKVFMEFPGMYHSLSIELGREAVFEEMLKWIDNKLAGKRVNG